MKNIIAFKTENKYNYLYNLSTRQFYLINDVTYKIFKLLEKGINIEMQSHILKEELLELSGELPLDYYISKVKTFLSRMQTNWMPHVAANFSSEQIKQEFFANPQVVFEVTEKCNLTCKYCVYGSYYTGFDERVNKDLSFEFAKTLINYILTNREGPTPQSITISFYGGEPLIKMNFIKEVVKFSKSLTTKSQDLNFTMTTNGTLINKHIEYLVKYNFNLLISLDGNQKNNSYRVYKNGRETFNVVIDNIDLIAKEYPKYFEKNVNFSAVLHNKNSIQEINDFIFSTYGKYPLISEIKPEGVLPNKKNEFLQMFKNKYEDLLHTKDYYFQLKKENIEKTPDFDSAMYFINNLTEMKISDLYKINNLKETKDYLSPTSTCLPLQRKIFVTANGKILPCESIDHVYSVGSVNKGSVNIDFEAISKSHNNYLNRIAKQCKKCYRVTSCMNCIFTMDFVDDFPICKEFTDKGEFSTFLSENMAFIESNKQVIKKIMYESELD